METYLFNLYGNNLFNLSSEILTKFGVQNSSLQLINEYSKRKIDQKPSSIYFHNLEYITFEGKKEKKPVYSLARTYFDGLQITIEKYSSKTKTNNHFCVLQFNNSQVYAKIIAIDTRSILCARKR